MSNNSFPQAAPQPYAIPTAKPVGGNPIWKYLGFGCGGVLLLCLVICCGSLVYFANGPEGGVRLADEMEPYAKEYLQDNQVLDPGERIVAYYDITIALDGTESATLTDKRLVYHKNGESRAIPISEITSVSDSDDGLGGVVITVTAENDDPMFIEIPVFNKGEVFLTYLEDAVSKAQ
ncbi:MAG: hypothetical protein AAFN70_06105 [Planctomycetota bacterium]